MCRQVQTSQSVFKKVFVVISFSVRTFCVFETGHGSEIALKYYEAGNLEMALEYADSDMQTNLRGKCLLSLARQAIAQHTDLLSLKPLQTTVVVKVSSHGPESPSVETTRTTPAGSPPTAASTAATPRSNTSSKMNPPPFSIIMAETAPETDKKTATTSDVSSLEDAKSTLNFAKAVTGSIKGFSNSAISEVSKVFDTVEFHPPKSQEQQSPKAAEQDTDVTEHDNPDITKAKEYLLEAITLFAGRDVVGSGEANLLLGTLEKDSDLLREALKHFDEHDAGYVECVDILRRLNSHIFSEHHGKLVIIALSRVLKLLAILNSLTMGLKDQRQLEMLYCFYGLRQTMTGRLKVMQAESSRVMRFFRREHIGRETDEETAKSVLQDILLTKASLWVQSICKTLKKAVSENQQCLSFVGGRKCTHLNCSMLHKAHDITTYENLLKSLLAMIILNSTIEKSLMESKGKLREDIKTITTNEPWKWCDELYHAMYPRHAHPFVVASNDTIARLVLQDVRVEPVRWFVSKYVEKKWKEADTTTRQANTDFLLKMHTLLCLVGEKPRRRLEDFLIEESQLYTNQAKKSPEAFQQACQYNLGFWIHGGNHKDVICYTYLGNFHKAIEHIHRQNPIEGLAHLNKFFGFIVKKHGTPLIPSFANTARLMEIMTVLVAGFQLRTYKQAVAILPASYLAAVNCWNAELEGVFDSDLYSSIQYHVGYGPHELSSVWGRARYMVKIMCGEVSQCFDVIREAFNEATCLATGEAERVLVLALVLLVNSGGEDCILPHDCAGMLKQAIGRLEVNQAVEENPRLATALKQVQVVNNRHDVVSALRTLLLARHNEYLLHCTWKWQTPGVKGISHEPIFLKKISKLTYLPPSADRPTQQFETSPTTREMTEVEKPDHTKPRYEETESEDHSSAEMSHQEMEQTKQEQEKRKLRGEKAVIIQKAYRAYVESKQRQLHKETKVSGKQGLIWKGPDWSFYKVDNVMCGICGLVFKQDEGSSMKEDDWLETSKEIIKGKASLDSNQGLGQSAVIKSKHVESQQHLERCKFLKVYKKLYGVEVLPVIDGIDKYLQELRSANTVSEALNMEIPRLEKSCQVLFEAMKRVQDTQQWGNIRDVKDSLAELQRCYDNVACIHEEERRVCSDMLLRLFLFSCLSIHYSTSSYNVLSVVLFRAFFDCHLVIHFGDLYYYLVLQSFP